MDGSIDEIEALKHLSSSSASNLVDVPCSFQPTHTLELIAISPPMGSHAWPLHEDAGLGKLTKSQCQGEQTKRFRKTCKTCKTRKETNKHTCTVQQLQSARN